MKRSKSALLSKLGWGWAVSVWAISLLASGCFYHSTQIELAPSADGFTEAGKLSESEIDRATKIVADVVSERGLLPSSSDAERLSREEDEWKEFVLASYWTGTAAATDNRVVVSILLDKETGRFRVLIRDLDSAGASDFTTSLEGSLTAALSEAFPSKTIHVERKTVGPALGP
jgi:hypothetical protein